MATTVIDYQCVDRMNLKAQISDASKGKEEKSKNPDAFNIIRQAAEDFVEKSKEQRNDQDPSAELPASLRGKFEDKPEELPNGKEEYANSVKENGGKDLKDEALNAMRSGDISWTYTHRYGLGWKGAESKKVSPEYAYERYMNGSFPELHVDPEKRVIHVNEYSLHDME